MATTNKSFRVKTGLTVEGAALITAAGTTAYPQILLTASSAPGVYLTSPTSGAFEYDGTSFYLTASSGGRKTIAYTDTAPASHAHGNITNSGTLTTSVTATSPVKVLITNSSDAIGLLTTTNASNTTFLRGDGTWVTPTDTNTNWYPTTFAYTGGTTAGPTGSLTGTGMSAVSFGAIPSAAVGASGIVTTGAQEFGGVKTLTSPSITTSLTTTSTTFALANTTATTVNFAGAATTLSVGASTGNTTVNNNLVVTGNLTVNGTTTTVNSTTVTVDDIVLELGAVGTPTDITAEGGGIKLLDAGTGKTITWSGTGSNWTTSENWNLATGKTLKINNSAVLSGTAAALVVGEGASTTIAIGANGGTATILNPTVTLTNATTLNIGGATSSIVGTTLAGAASVFNTNTGTVNFGGAALNVNLGGSTNPGTTNLSVGNQTTGTHTTNIANGNVTDATKNILIGTGNVSGSGTIAVQIGVGTGTAANIVTTIGNTVRLPGVGTSGLVRLGANGVLSAETATYVSAASPALTGTPTINSIAGLVTASGSTTGTTALTLSTVYASGTYNGGEFIVKATNSTNIEITKVLVITDGTNVYMTTYGDVFVSSDLVAIDFTYTGANVNMVVTPVAGTTGTTTVKVTGTLVAV